MSMHGVHTGAYGIRPEIPGLTSPLELCGKCATTPTPEPTVTQCETCGEPIHPTPRIHHYQETRR